jgi:hypothetical protein
MLRALIAFVAGFACLGVGNFVTIVLAKQLGKPLVLVVAVPTLMAVMAAIAWLTAPAGLTGEEKRRWFARALGA